MRRWSVAAAIAMATWLVLMVPSPASAGGIGCVDGTGSYTLTTIGGSFDAFSWQLGPHQLILWVHKRFRVTMAMAGTKILHRGPGKTLRYHSAKPMTSVQLCVSPDVIDGSSQASQEATSGYADVTNNNPVTVNNDNATNTIVSVSNQPAATVQYASGWPEAPAAPSLWHSIWHWLCSWTVIGFILRELVGLSAYLGRKRRMQGK